MIMEIEDKNFSKINTSNFREKLISYQQEYPCCIGYSTPHCTHAKHQSDSYLHKRFNVISDSLHSCLNKNNIKVNITHLWVFITYENELIDSIWHNHYDTMTINKDLKQLTALMYLTHSKIGTEFENNYVITPELNKWYVWDSKLNHKPLETKTGEKRVIISTALEVLE